MSEDLGMSVAMKNDLYQSQIIEWSKKTDHVMPLPDANCRATASNPLCGDRISVEVRMDCEVIKAMSCQVKGCLLCKASSSILAEQAEGKTIHELRKISSDLDGALKSAKDDPGSFPEGFSLFSPVSSHKSRRSCVMLPLKAVMQAISEYRPSSEKGVNERL